MSLLAAVIAGLVATVVMTMMMYMAPMMGVPKMDMLQMLGSMMVPMPRTVQGSMPESNGMVLGVGAMMHAMMGVVFAIIYALLWSVGLGSASWLWGLVFGAVHSLMAFVGMPMMSMHPQRPVMPSGMMVAAGMVMAHMVFGLVLALVYRAMG
jgi:uncharacterized membrane protein YagU involved in acid resistance